LAIRTNNFLPGLSCLGTLMLVSAVVTGADNPDLIRTRNQGAAYYENQDYPDAVPPFESCVEFEDAVAADWINLGLAYYRTKQWEEAVEALETADSDEDSYPHIAYALGLILKKNDAFEAAAERFEKVVAQDPAEAPAYYSLGVMYQKLGRDDDAERAFQAVVRHDPQHASAHYYLFKYAKAAGRRDEAKREMRIFSRLQREIPDKQRTEAVYEESQYLTPIIPPHQSFMPADSDHRGRIRFVDVTKEAGLHGPSPFDTDSLNYPQVYQISSLDGSTCLVDLDGDNDLDLYVVRCSDERSPGNRLYLNDGSGHFSDVSSGSGAANTSCGHYAVAGDIDNNGTVDIVLFNYREIKVLSNDGTAHFTDLSDRAGLRDSTVVGDAELIDYDHDGDLDLLIGVYGSPGQSRDGWMMYVDKPEVGFDRWRDLMPETNRIYRNNGDGSFTKVEDSVWGNEVQAWTIDVECGDFDNDDDTDWLSVNVNAPCQLHLNLRQGQFATSEPLGEEGAERGTACDFDNDGDLDVLLVRAKGAHLYLNSGDATFTEKRLPILTKAVTDANISAVRPFDFDNDGLIDITMTYDKGDPSFHVNLGQNEFQLLTNGPALTTAFSAWEPDHLTVGDIDNDGDLDLVGHNNRILPFILENRGGESANWLKVQPVGIRVPKQGIGAKLEIKAGPYYQRRDVHQWPVHFGLGEVDKIDVLRITWTNGIVQNMVDVPTNEIYKVEEIVRTDASCPFLFTFDGEKFNYINDILGVSAMGVPLDEGFYHHPDPDEYVRIDGTMLAPFDGRYLLRLAAELKETVYLDQVKLIAVDHPSNVDVYPNERFSEPPFMEPGLHTVKERRHPVAATDYQGNNILPLIEKTDHRYPSNIPMSSYDGLAQRHWFEFDLGDLRGHETITMFLTGWIYWSSASANVAISQNRQVGFEVVSLSVPDADGEWITVIDDIGLPNGKNSTIPVHLSGLFPSDDFRVRLTTNLVVYWDEVFFTVGTESYPADQIECRLSTADLHYRGFSNMRQDSLGMEFFDYAAVNKMGPWRQHSGRYTRYGEVSELLTEPDDRYVIYGPGEEISFEFEAPPLPKDGWRRDFFLYAFGWIKDGDPNTVHSVTVGPLPFIDMPGYPYDSSLSGRADEIAGDLADWLTREQVRTVRPLR